MELWQQTIVSQYGNSPTLGQMLENINGYLDPAANFDQFYALVWNIDTAEGWGLDVWGRIVGVGRVLQVSSGTWFGFAEASDSNGFNQQAFYNGAPVTQNFILSDPAYRVLILAKAAANITDGSIPAINQILLALFPGLGGYVTDGENMSMTYTFSVAPSAVQLAIISQSGVLPKPTGVSVTVVHP